MNTQQIECGCDETDVSILSTQQALDLLTEAVKPSQTTQTTGLDEALGRVLAVDVVSNINVPSFDNSAMDGYAIHLEDEQINATGTHTFKITDRIPAGSVGEPLAAGCCARIFTGAPIPMGANTVIMQEACEVLADNSHIETWQPLLLNDNIRPMGNDITQGRVILQAGMQLRPQDIALAASVGVAELDVFKKIKVGVFFTGDELLEPGNTLSAGEIFNSNRYALVALLNALHCEVVNLGNVKDDLKATCNALDTLQQSCNLIITTGGVSVGEADHVKAAVKQLGVLSLWRIKMKPGKPLAFGKVGKTAFIGLPGNPVSAMVTFFLFAQPMIKKMQGMSDFANKFTQVQCNFDWTRPRSRREFVRVQLDHSSVPASAKLYPKQGSDVLSSMVWADGLVEIPENSIFTQGEILNYYPL